eukprot:CAMPEP_0113676468 /NCGR_PEP_ID=MMETSP0038_2-20120614/8659_1 /TAXON_ID=2898 /ORGANISM="Cryptomonas paramecium" /LENGTH=81 /DNA_ID=CAMNT_0000593499 /DNA_START=72 /DNA_END=317 /DNA_ORIENTATION=+ /assembly_acc=CAM_ASM_000170
MQRSIASSAVKALRVAAPVAKKAAQPKAVTRNMSGGHSSSDLDTWRNISIGGFGFMLLLAGYEYYVHKQHHEHGPPLRCLP